MASPAIQVKVTVKLKGVSIIVFVFLPSSHVETSKVGQCAMVLCRFSSYEKDDLIFLQC